MRDNRPCVPTLPPQQSYTAAVGVILVATGPLRTTNTVRGFPASGPLEAGDGLDVLGEWEEIECGERGQT